MAEAAVADITSGVGESEDRNDWRRTAGAGVRQHGRLDDRKVAWFLTF
jgi:hypothetical protein